MSDIKTSPRASRERGARGPTGPTGATGGSSAAYGYAAGINDDAIPAGTDVAFDLGGLMFPNVGITPPSPGGNSFVVLTAGDYEYDFYVAGQHANAATRPLEFAIFVNSSPQGAAHEFRSNQQAAASDVQVCRGQGIISLQAGDVVTLNNRTFSPTVLVTAIPPGGGEQAANRTLSLKKLSP